MTSSPGSQQLPKDTFVDPENPLAVKRSPRLVEGKLTTSLGEAVFGEPLPPNHIVEPTTSFDEKGYFRGIIEPPKMEHAGEYLGYS